MALGRIIIIRPDHLGDLILSLPVAQTIRERYPNSHISYLAASGPSGISELVDYVDDWLIDSGTEGRSLTIVELSRKLSEQKFDCSIELKPSWRTSLATFKTQIPIRIGTSRRFYSFLYNHRVNIRRKSSGFHQTDLDLALLRPLGINIDGIFPKLVVGERHKLAARKLVGDRINRYIVIHPGSSGSSPNWPESSFRKLAELILSKAHFAVVITGQENQRPFEGCINLGGKTSSVGELAGVISGAALFISGNTGPLHLADALGIRCLSFILNRADIGVERWGPRRNLDTVMRPAAECLCQDMNQCRCLEQIKLEMVFERVNSLLENNN